MDNTNTAVEGDGPDGASVEASNTGITLEINAPTAEQEHLNVEQGDHTITHEQINSGQSTNVKECNPNPTTKPPTKRQTTKPVNISNKKVASEVWDHFTRLVGSNPPRAACNYCGTTYAAHSRNNGTGSLWTHIETICKKYPFRLQKKQKTLHDFENLSESLLGKAKNFEELRNLIAEMIIEDGLPFMFVEGSGFQKLIRGFDPKFLVPSRHSVARDCMKIFVREKTNLRKLLKNERVCLTTDTWTSVQNLNYMCLTAHWISSDWKLEKRIINFCIVESHKGEIIAKQVEECLLEWGIEKIFTITVDNASSNDRALNHLKKKCKWKDTILNNEYMHVRCSAHIVNLIVKEGLEEQNAVLMRVRNAVKYVRSSPARLKAFKTCVAKEKITSKSLVCLDVETRWNSTYMMLEAAEKFEKAFERLGDEDKKFIDYFDCYEVNQDNEFEGKRAKGKGNKIIGPPKDDDWVHARNFVKFLKIFYNVTLKFSGSSYVTSNLFFRELASVHMALSSMISNGDYQMSSMAFRMKEKFNKYWGNINNMNLLLFVAIVLDPRYKLKYVSFCFSTMYEGNATLIKRMTEKLEEVFHLLFKQYDDSDGKKLDKDKHATQGSSYNMIDGNDDLSEMLESQFDRHLEQEESIGSKSEIASYLLDGCEKREPTFDILSWWKVNTSKYPVLSKVARDVLAIPVSTIASESAFSVSGRVIDPFRSSLSPKMVEALICAQDWLRVSPSPIDLRSAMEDIEQFEEIEKELQGSSSSTTTDN